ncbi:lysosome membrane protein 2-like [Convolutriloba macropyga]|uniref:lysosome membrane protein 2-like n=1 Tax=Convolutriloba macropyga TaxID=536237 RepID=UPI003F522ABD
MVGGPSILETFYSENFILRHLIGLLINSDSEDDDTDIVNSVSPFYVVEAGNFIWGYSDNLFLEQLAELDSSFPTRIGLQVNNTNDGLYEILTGKEDQAMDRGIVEKWDNNTNLPFWYKDTCNMINGTDGSLFPVEVSEYERLYMFNSKMCRSIFLEAGKHELLDGVETTKFTVPPEVFEVDFEDNVGFCRDAEAKNCIGNGLLDVSSCYDHILGEDSGLLWNLSVVLSNPEFLYCDPKTIDSIIGFEPNPEQHETYINIETSSGTVLKSAKRTQTNTMIKKYTGIDFLSNLPDGWQYLVPVFWLEEVVPVDNEVVDFVEDLLRVRKTVLTIAYLYITIGCAFILAALIKSISCFYKVTRTHKADKEKLMHHQF